jgi:hypothetical protein
MITINPPREWLLYFASIFALYPLYQITMIVGFWSLLKIALPALIFALAVHTLIPLALSVLLSDRIFDKIYTAYNAIMIMGALYLGYGIMLNILNPATVCIGLTIITASTCIEAFKQSIGQIIPTNVPAKALKHLKLSTFLQLLHEKLTSYGEQCALGILLCAAGIYTIGLVMATPLHTAIYLTSATIWCSASVLLKQMKPYSTGYPVYTSALILAFASQMPLVLLPSCLYLFSLPILSNTFLAVLAPYIQTLLSTTLPVSQLSFLTSASIIHASSINSDKYKSPTILDTDLMHRLASDIAESTGPAPMA